jgi:hypothetical protein
MTMSKICDSRWRSHKELWGFQRTNNIQDSKMKNTWKTIRRMDHKQHVGPNIRNTWIALRF